MSTIAIEWLSDDYDCETCGSSYADGANVEIDGKTALALTPAAHCFGGRSWAPTEVFVEILKLLGHTVTETNGASS